MDLEERTLFLPPGAQMRHQVQTRRLAQMRHQVQMRRLAQIRHQVQRRRPVRRRHQVQRRLLQARQVGLLHQPRVRQLRHQAPVSGRELLQVR